MKLCYLCGVVADSRDHLPPKCFFPKPAPPNLITVPCCRQCNNSYSLIDEKFRAFVAADEQRNAAGWRVFREKVLKPNSAKGRSFIEIASTLTYVTTRPGDLRSLKPKISLPLNEGRQFLVRLTKGLVCKFYPALHRQEGHFHCEYLSDPDDQNPVFALAKQVMPHMICTELGDGVFSVCRVAQERDSLWVYSFYGGSTFLVYHTLDDPLLIPRLNGS